MPDFRFRPRLGLLAFAVLALPASVAFYGYDMYREQTTFYCGTADAEPATCGNVLTEEESRGNDVFKQSCNRCHYGSDKKLVGPGLAGVHTRMPDTSASWMRGYIGNSDSLFSETNNAYIAALRKEYHPIRFNHNFRYTERQWSDLLVFLNSL